MAEQRVRNRFRASFLDSYRFQVFRIHELNRTRGDITCSSPRKITNEAHEHVITRNHNAVDARTVQKNNAKGLGCISYPTKFDYGQT